MEQPNRVSILSNTASGSYSAAALDQLASELRDCGCDIACMISFPQDDLPTIEQLKRDQIDILAIFTGDGTISSCVAQLYGWDGAVLVLPGGTMNLLSHRLHGDADAKEIVRSLGAGEFSRVRRNAVSSAHGAALVVFSAGPATGWYEVRETMRDADVTDVINEASEAFAHSLNDPMIRVGDPALGAREGYPLIEVSPHSSGLEITAYNPETVLDYVKQGWLTLVRRFREGPHDVLATVDHLVLEDVAGTKISLSIDGEPRVGQPREELSVAQVAVDLIATAR